MNTTHAMQPVILDSDIVSGSRRLKREEISFEDEMMVIGNRLNFYMPLYFDIAEVFGEKPLLKNEDGYINVYANYDLALGCVCDMLEIVKVVYDGSETEYYYPLSKEEKTAILEKMEQYRYGSATLESIKEEYLSEKSSVLAQLADARIKAEQQPVSNKTYEQQI